MAEHYSIPTLEKESANGIQQVSLLTEAFSQRRIFLFGEINEVLVYSFTMQMLNLMEDEQSKIDIYINSPGGEVNAGLAIYDLMQSSRAPIRMFCIGMAASMGAVLLAGAPRGRRFILPHSKVMIHEPLILGGVGGSASNIKSTADSILQTRDIINGILAKHSGRTREEIDKVTDHDHFMSAEEAVAFGLCDKVVGRII